MRIGEIRVKGADALVPSIAALIEQLGRQVQNICFTKDLAPVQWSALRFLAKSASAARNVSGLAAYSGVNASSASRTIQQLLQKKLVSIATGPWDNRVKTVSLTQSGRDLLERDPLDNLADVVSLLTPAEQVALRDILEKLLFGLCPKPFDSDQEFGE